MSSLKTSLVKKRIPKPELTPDQQQEIKEAFDLFDTDKGMKKDSTFLACNPKFLCIFLATFSCMNYFYKRDGFNAEIYLALMIIQLIIIQLILSLDAHLDYHELKVAMRALGFDAKKAEVLKILRDSDKTGQGKSFLEEDVNQSNQVLSCLT